MKLSPGRNQGSSLIVSLLILVVLCAVVMAFLQSMAIERAIAKSYRQRLQAELAAQAGQHTAIAQILTGMGTNAFVTGLTNLSGHIPVTIIGRTNLTDPAQLMPLVSSPSLSPSTFPGPLWASQLPASLSDLTNGLKSVDVNTRKAFLQATTNTNLYRAAWVLLSDSSGANTARYAFVGRDEMARVNPLLHNGSGSRTHATDWDQGPRVISLTNSNALLLTSAQALTMASLAGVMVTHEMLGHAFVSRADFDRVRHQLTISLNISSDLIPAWLTNGGRSKYALNDRATNLRYGATAVRRAAGLADTMQTHLTNFASRDPSLRGNPSAERRYLERLAACLVDYIDPDSQPTSTTSGEPAGRDLFPVVTAIAERTVLTSIHTNIAEAAFESRFFVQVWNPYTTSILLTNTALQIANRPRLNFGSGIVQTFPVYDQTNSTAVTVRPNEFAVIDYPPVRHIFRAPPSSNFPFWGHGTNSFDTTDTGDQTTWLPFRFLINGQVVDLSRRPPVGPGLANSGLTRSFKRFATVNAAHYQVNFIPTQPQGAGPLRSVGDPRATFLCNYDWGTPLSSDSTYARETRWKGRQTDSAPRYQDFERRWLHRDYIPRNPSEGRAPGNVQTLPTAVPSAYNSNDATAAIAVLRNGPMVSIGELGHIFDPVQADDLLAAPHGGSPASPYVSAGGRTLRIGQPEFATTNTNTWDTNGRRAIELIDLFTVRPTNEAGFATARGCINPNTASPEVLQAVLSGIEVTSDSGRPSARLVNLDAMAQQIVSHRPYNSLAGLHKILPWFAQGTNYHPAFATQLGGGTTNLRAVDRVREEAFGKLIPHLAVQSRTYRILTIGEALDAREKPCARAVLETIVYFETTADGRLSPRIEHQRYLP